MYATTTALAAVNVAATDVGLFIALVVGIIFTAWAGLTGLGFFKRKATHYVAGRKF
jgi:hypothetical protein